MKRNLLLITICVMVLACKEQPVDIQVKSTLFNSYIIDTLIFSTDTLHYSFGYFGDEEGISMIQEPVNAQSFEILNKQWEERILQYIPKSESFGLDSMTLVTVKGSDGASPAIAIDSIVFKITHAKNNFHSRLIGKWNWISSCGGFTGGCWYPTDRYKLQLEFNYDMSCILSVNDSLKSYYNYFFRDSYVFASDTIYKIEFDTGFFAYYMINSGNLFRQPGDFMEEYEKIE